MKKKTKLVTYYCAVGKEVIEVYEPKHKFFETINFVNNKKIATELGNKIWGLDNYKIISTKFRE